MNPGTRGEGRNYPRLRHLLVVAALLAVGVPAAASRFPQQTPMVTVPDTGGAYVEGAVGNPSYLNPILLQFNQLDRDLSALLFSGLTRFDEKGLIVPDLAESWEIGDGGKSYLFHLKRNVRWHDRTPFTSYDVAFTVKALQAPDFQGSPEVADLWRNVGLEQIDDYAVQFTLKEPFAPFLEYTTVGLLPRHLYSDALGQAMLSSPYNLRPVGTGPFKLTRITGEGVTLEPHADYYGPVPNLAQLRFRFYPDYASAVDALDKGEVDGLPYLDSQDVAKLKASEKMAVHSVPDYLKYSVLFLNDANPVFKEKAVRQAVAHAINQQRLVDVVLDGRGTPGKGPISPGSWAFDPKAKSYGYDPKKAEAILEAADWRDSDGDGIRDKNGVSLSFVILTNDNQRRVRTGELVAADLQMIGFKAGVQALAWTDLLKDYLAPRTFLGTIAEQWLLTADPDVFSLWHSSQSGDGGFNFSGMANDRIDRTLEEARRTVDGTRRQQLYSEFQELWAEEIPSIVLYYPEFDWAVNRNLKGVQLTSLIDGSSRFRNVAQWYLKTKQVPATKTK